MPPKKQRNIKVIDDEDKTKKEDKKQNNKKKPIRKMSREIESEEEFSDSTDVEESDIEEELELEEVDEDDNLDDEKEGDDESTESKSVADVEDVEEIADGDDECLYKNVKVAKKEEDDDEEEEVLVFDDDDKKFDEVIPKEKRITKPFLTKYERVRILGDRAKQLSLGAKPMIKGTEGMNPKDVARAELEQGMVPFTIIRTLPNGSKEYWDIKELKIVN